VKNSYHENEMEETVMRRRCCRSISIIALWLIALGVQPLTFAKGRVEHHQMTSKILADAGEPAKAEVSVYLPQEYETSGLAYPTLYLIHQYGGTHLVYVWWMEQRADALIEKGEAKPLIIVSPDMGGTSRKTQAYDNYLIGEMIPFVDGKYRTIPRREGRSIAGWSRGGGDAMQIAFLRPEVFSLAGGYASGGARSLPGSDLIKAHNQNLFPLQFWFTAGRKDQFSLHLANRILADNLKAAGIPYLYVEDDSDHRIPEEGFKESLIFFSERLGGGVVSVQPHGKLAAMWVAERRLGRRVRMERPG
jgi:enterochelin esterase-like enzyme